MADTTDIYSLVQSGALDKKALKTLKRKGNLPDILNRINPTDQKTPLYLAVTKVDLKTVELLLSYGADPNIQCVNNQTALWYAASIATPSALEKDIFQIIRRLINYKARVDEVDSKYGRTPLMNAIVVREIGRARLLLKNGADRRTVKNKNGKTAYDMAVELDDKDWKVLLEPQKSWFSKIVTRTLQIGADMVLGFIDHVSSTARSFSSKVQNVFNKKTSFRYGAPRFKGTEPDQSAPGTLTSVEISKTLNDDLEKSNIKKFFPKGNKLLETIIEKAANLAKSDAQTPKPPSLSPKPSRDRMQAAMSVLASAPENVIKLVKLSLYQPILFLDNSSSMTESTGIRIKVLNEWVERVLFICTRLVPDDCGVLVRFLNDEPGFLQEVANVQALETLQDDMSRVRYNGNTPLGTNLRKFVLEPYVYKPIREKKFNRPVLVSVVTDGEPNGEGSNYFQQVIVECKEFLTSNGFDPIHDVRFLVSQVGDSSSAAQFLLDLRNDPKLKDFVHITTERLDDQFKDNLTKDDGELEQWLLDTLLRPIIGAGTDP